MWSSVLVFCVSSGEVVFDRLLCWRRDELAFASCYERGSHVLSVSMAVNKWIVLCWFRVSV